MHGSERVSRSTPRSAVPPGPTRTRLRRFRTRLGVLGVVVTMAAAWMMPTPAAAVPRLPVPYSFAAGIVAQLAVPGSAPPAPTTSAVDPVPHTRVR